MEFSPAFSLLVKFTTGIETKPKSEDDVIAVSKYLGINVPGGDLADQAAVLSNELSRQNCFLSKELEYDAIFDSNEYRKSKSVREIVANNRINRQNAWSLDR